jgi:hypothetical protein
MPYCGASTAAKKAQDIILSFKPSMYKKNVQVLHITNMNPSGKQA